MNVRKLALLAGVGAALVFPGAANASFLWWSDDGNSQTTVGPNASLTISMGTFTVIPSGCAGGVNDSFFPQTDIYVIAAGSAAEGAALVDASGSENAIFGASGGLFIEETIAFTAPGGNLGGGVYDVVYDECQDGKFQAAQDSVFPNAITVSIPAANVPAADPAIQAYKNAAGVQAVHWLETQFRLVALLTALDLYEKAQCALDPIECFFGTDAIIGYAVSGTQKLLGVDDPKDAALAALANQVKHYQAIKLDPPDPAFTQVTPIGPVSDVQALSDDPLVAATAAFARAASQEQALAEALLRSVERYQGADIAGNGEWALAHARAMTEYGAALSAQIEQTTTELEAFGAALATDTRDLDGYAADLETLRARVATSGFTLAEIQALRNAGLSEAAVEELEDDFAAETFAGTESALQADIAAQVATNDAAVTALGAFGNESQQLVSALEADPGVFLVAPVASAGGPYTVAEGGTVALDGSGSGAWPGATLATYEWDLDGDGAFDDAPGATPSFVFQTARDGRVGVKVTDDRGWSDIAYSALTVTETNAPPVIATHSPALLQQVVPAGSSQVFAVTTTDPEGDAVSVAWTVDGVAAGTGPSFSYAVPATGGTHIVRAVASDGPTGGSAAVSWSVTAELADGDGDGWNANADCVDTDPAIPGEFEIVGNSKDDDCDAATPDEGSAPVAAFSTAVAPGLVATFTDESTDANDDVVEWLWDFGDGTATSTAQNPVHTYATKGTRTVTLTVEDATGRTHTLAKSVGISSAPVSAFTYQPPSPVGGSEVDFTDASTDSDGEIVGWAWTFGDGGTSSERNPSHVYLAPGTFTVGLTVTDDDGSTGTSSQDVVIGVGDPGTAPLALFRADVPGRDLAALANGATVVADSGTCCGGHEAYQMLDDVVGYPWATNGLAPKFATIQIGATPRSIDQIQIQPRSDCCDDQRVRNFAVDVSTTGFAATDFTQVLAATTANTGTLQTFPLPAGTTAKYVRYRPLTNNGSCCYLSTSKFKVLTASSGPRRVTFQNQSTNAASYKWTFGDGETSTAASPTHTYAAVGSYTVTLVAKAADGRTSTVSRVYEARGPSADFSVDPAVPEPGQPAVFTDSSLTPSAPATAFAWDFGDGGTSTSAGTLHTFAAAGTYAVKYTVTDAEGNADTVTRNVVVAEADATALPVARFNPSSGGLNVAFSGAGASTHSFSTQYSGSYPPATILDQEPSNTYWATANGVRTGWVKVDLAGDLQLVDRIRLGGDGGGERVQDFRVSVSSTTADDAAFTQVLAAKNPNDDTLREYVFSGGAVSARYVRLELLNNWGGLAACCVSVDRFDVFTSSPTNSGRNLALASDGATIPAFSGTYDPNGYPVSSLIDGNPGSQPWLTPNGTTSGWAKVTLSNGIPRMIDRIRLQGRFRTQNVKDFEIAVSTTGTADRDFVTVLSARAADNESLQTFALPYPMPAKHILYRPLNNYSNCCYVGTGDLRVDTGQESNGLTVRFRNLSRRATSYLWDFGDGSTSADASPAHTYAAAGTYPVTLTATNANGSTTFSLEQVVRAPTFSFTPAAPEAQQQIDFLDESPAELGLQSWSWDFGDGSTSALRHPIKTYAAPGTYTVTLTGTDREGVPLSTTRQIVVAPSAFRAQFHPRGTFNMASLENGAAVIAYSSRYFDSAWWPDKLLDAYPDTAWHTNASPAENTGWIKFSLARGETYQIDRFQLLGRQLCCQEQHPRDFEIAVSTTGTADADFKTVLRATLPASQTTLQTYMLPRPVLAKYVLYRALNNRGGSVVTTAMLRAASGQVNTTTVTFDDLTVGGAAPLTYVWDFGDGGTSSASSPTHTFPGPGVYDVSVTVTDATGATSSSTLRQRILNAPTASFSNAPVVPNEVQSATFTDTTASPVDGPIVERRWTWGDGTAQTVTSAAATTHAFADNGSYNVKLEVLDAWGQTASVTRTIAVANVAPTVEAGPSWRWREDRVLTAAATTTDVAGGNDPVTCTWNYGDGTAPGVGCAFSHAYASTGTYTATVTASDGDGGTATDSFSVEVIEQEITGSGGGGSGAAGGTGVGKVAKDYTFTVDDDYELGTLLNVNHDAPGANQLQLNKQAKPFPFVYIANSGRGTAVRIDVDSGAILGEYMTAPVNRSRNPSRTTVDKLGNVWVTNRDEGETRTIDGLNTAWGSTTRIGLIVGGARSNADGTPNPAGEYLKAPFEYNTCVDKNSDGLIRTSRGLANILAWPNASGVDHDGGVETAVDECIQFYIRVRGTNTRTVAIDADNDAWIGGANNWHEEVDGETGQRVPGTAFNLNCGGYGGLIDGNGILWSARYGTGLLRYDTNTRTGVCLTNNHGDYGLGVDPVTGNIWQTTLSGDRVVKLDPTKTTTAGLELARYQHGHQNAQGVAVDAKGSVWVAHSILAGAPTIGRVRTDGVFLGTANLGGGTGSTGVAVDANGKVWSANLNTSNASRIDPEIGQKIAGTVPSGWFDKVVDLGPGAAPYNYSDMTGAVAIGAASPSGFWSIQQDGTALGTVWKRIAWNGSTPGGTTITVEARAADTQAALTSTPFVEAQDGALLAGVVGRFVEVRATLQTNDPTTTPILTDIRISANTPPVATGANVETPKNTPKPIPLAATDEDGDPLTYELVDGPAQGTVTIAADVATYTPASGYTGPDSFTFKARDATGESNVATVAIQVTQVNAAPTAADDTYTMRANRTLVVAAPGVLGNDTDPDGDALTVISHAQSIFSETSIAIRPDGSLEYTPRANLVGTETIRYTVSDGVASTDAYLTITIDNTAPVAVDDSYATDEDTVLSVPAPGVLANDTDADGHALSPVLGAPPAHGQLALAPDGSFTYTPEPNFSGADSFTYRADDGIATSPPARVSISVVPVNDQPVANDQTVATDEDTPLDITLGGSDLDGDTLSYAVASPPLHGTWNGTTYTPAPNYHGPDSFAFLVSDGNGGTDLGTVTITVRPVNDAPAAAGLEVTTDEDTPLPIVLAGTDTDGDTLSITTTDPAHGTYAGGVYTPAANYNGPDSFTYTVNDGNGGTATAVVRIAVRPANDAPAVDARSVVTDEDTPLPISLAGTDLDGDTLTITTSDPTNGTYAGSIYTPTPNYSGPDSFTYTASDGNGGTATATVTITVRPVNDAPVAGDQAVATDEDTPLALVLGSTDVDGGAPVFALATTPQHGTWDGTAYTPDPNYHGPDSFDFFVSDGAGGSDVGTISITVRPVNDAPVAADQSVVTDEDTPLPIALAGADVDGDTLTYALADPPAHGSFSGGVYTPAPDYHGPDTFTFTAADGAGGSDTGRVTITVRPVNDAPTANDQAVETDEDAPVPVTLTGADIDGDALTFVVVSGPARGTYAGGVYTPAPNYFGPDAFEFEARDGNGGVDRGTVTITVHAVNEPPTVTLAGAAAVDEGAAPVSLTATGADPDGDALTYAWSSDSGTLVPAGASATFAHDDGPRIVTVTVTVSDGSATGTASLPVTVRNVAPSVVAGPPASGSWGLAIVLAGSATDPSAADTASGLAAQWSFGDGSLPVVGLSAGHVYAVPGIYLARLTVVDKDGGIGTGTRQVTVAKRATAVAYTGPANAPFGLRTLTAQLTDTVHAPTADLAGKTISFSLGTRTFTAVTNGAGVATATAALPLTSGDVVVSFAGDARYLPSSSTARLTIESAPGKITGGGLRSLNHAGRGGFNVHSADKGELQWQNGTLNFHAPEISGLGVAPDGRSAWFAGTGRDGRPYVAYVEDNGEPGRADIFKLWVGGVLQTPGDGRLSGGNIQIHKS